MRNQTFFQSILGILIIGAIGLIGISVLSSANVTKLRPNIYEFTLDTIAQSASGTFTIPDQNKSRTGIGFEIRAVVGSGTADALGIIQESFFEDADYWYNRDTVVISAAGVYKWEDTYRAPWMRLYILADTTTQSVRYNVAAAAVQDF